MIRAVIDANVLLSASIHGAGTPGQVISHSIARDFQLVVSDEIVAELFRIVHYPRVARSLRRKGKEPAAALRFIQDVIAEAFRVHPADLGERVAPDPADDKYIATAIAGFADFVVTGDKPFLSVSAYRVVRIVSPLEFLAELNA